MGAPFKPFLKLASGDGRAAIPCVDCNPEAVAHAVQGHPEHDVEVIQHVLDVQWDGEENESSQL